METYPPTARTTPLRSRERVAYDVDAVRAVLDEGFVCHLGFVVDGEPRMLPTLHARVGDTLYLHGSTGSRPMLAARAEDLPVCVTVTLLDGLVLARSHFNHSVNYRSVVVHGVARLVSDPRERHRAFTSFVDKVASGRADDSRPPTEQELAATAVLALPLTEVSIKTRAGRPIDEPEDYSLPHWAGVVPLRLTAGEPIPDEGVISPVPRYLRDPVNVWHTAPSLRGRHVHVDPLDLSHVDGLFAALDDEAVWPWLTIPRPAAPEDLFPFVRAALSDPGRVAMVQTHPDTGEVLGSTSYYAIDPVNRSIAIGHTMLGRRSWRTAVNTETKLLLMARAFDDLGALRVEWHVDLENRRSQTAVERLGATREGVLRRHKKRPNGTWRDTVVFSMTSDEWPAARTRLTAALAAGGTSASV
jgi:nitroimidazol reductase NimA-like FMN-containing flavoprotein (pyridoxamine 5'-phosphate oxidase superfamily)/RimJ/RimL family protein N-acetyltransferase